MEKPKITSYVKMPRSTSEVGSVDYEAYSHALEQYIAFLGNKKRRCGGHSPAGTSNAIDWLDRVMGVMFYDTTTSDKIREYRHVIAALMADFANWYYENK